MKKNRYAFVVLNWNGEKDTCLCLDSLDRIHYRSDFDIIVVDSGSNPKSLSYIKNHVKNNIKRKVKLVPLPKNQGFTGGHIEGLKHTDAEIICLLNNDAVVSYNILTEADSIINELGNNFGAIGGRAYFWNNQQKAFDIWNEFFTFQKIDPLTATAYTIKGDPGESLAPKVVDNVSGACVFVNRSAINTAGYLDDQFFAYYEETDMFARFKRCGFEIYYCPTIRYWHRFDPREGSHGASSKHIKNFSSTLIARNQFIFAFKNFETTYLFKFLIWYYTRFFSSILKLFIKPHERSQNFIIIKTTLSNIPTIPRLMHDRRVLTKTLPEMIGYNTKIIQEAQRKTVVFTNNLLSETIDIVEKNINPNDRVHLYTAKKCNTNLAHRCMKLRVDKQQLYSLSAALSRTDSVIVIESRVVKNSLLKKEIGKLNSNVPYRKKQTGIFSFNKAFVYQLAGINLTPGQITNWHTKPDKKGSYVFRKFFGRLSRKPRKLMALLYDYLLFRFRTGGYKDLFRSLFGLVKNSLLKTSYMVAMVRAGAHEQRLYKLRQANNQSINTIKLSGITVEEIPVFINCRDRVKTLKQTINALEHVGFRNIYLVDNQSSYPPLLEFYNYCSYQVILLGENMGHKAPWESLAVKLLSGGNPYVVTDPDVVLSGYYSKETIHDILELFDTHPGYVKIGAGLAIDDIPDYYEHKKTVQKWEAQFWTMQIENSTKLIAYDAEIDTTFAIYRPNLGYITLPSIRLGGKHTARHLPWYQDSRKPDDEESYYRDHASSAVNTWNKDSLPEYLQDYIN